MESKTITRTEIAALFGVTARQFQTLYRYKKGVNLPAPCGKQQNIILYDRKEIMDWFAAYQAKLNNPAGVQGVSFLALRMGKFDPAYKQNRHQLKRLASKVRKPVTTIIKTGYNDYFI
jgi:phage terminase Nu1 subunit (DNA packaging protein)